MSLKLALEGNLVGLRPEGSVSQCGNTFLCAFREDNFGERRANAKSAGVLSNPARDPPVVHVHILCVV